MKTTYCINHLNFLMFLAFFLIQLNANGLTRKISSGDVWKYYDQGNVNNLNWNTNAYIDNFWSSGPSELGYGDGDENTVISFGPNSSNKYITSYFRKTFMLTSQSTLTCSMKIDDGAVVYLNGVEVYRNSLPTGTITYSTLATSSNENSNVNFTIPAMYTLVGQNLFAIEIHQQGASSSDLSFDITVDADEAVIPPPPSGIYINEILASNKEVNLDSNGNSNDWIEIFNNTNSTLDLANYYFTDTKTNLTKYRFPTTVGLNTIPPFSYKIFWASGDTLQGTGHLPWSLSSDGEYIGLISPDAMTIIDSLTYPKLRSDISFGRLYSNIDSLVFINPPSPGSQNIVTDAYLGILEPPNISHQSGIYSNPFSLTATNTNGATIIYTNDASEPDINNISGNFITYLNQYPENPGQSIGSFSTASYITYQYNSAINITQPINEPAKTAQINTTYAFSPDFLAMGNIEKLRIMKFKNIKPGYIPSYVESRTFLINPRTYSLPITSVQIAPKMLSDFQDGIYVAGADFVNWRNANPTLPVDIWKPANYWRDLYVDGSISFFENNILKLEQNAQLRIAGRGSKRYRNKGITVKGSSKFDNNDEIEAPIFNTEINQQLKKIILRASGNDIDFTFFRDASVHTICSKLRYEKQRYKASTFYLNGEYWGIINLRDKLDDDFLSLKYNINEDSLEVIEENDFPTKTLDFENLFDFIKNNDMSNNSNYNYAESKIDMPSFIDWTITQTFFGNFDGIWGNYGFWRYFGNNKVSNTVKDGKWRWYLFDMDWSFDGTLKIFQKLKLNTDEDYYPYKYLTANSNFKNDFINRYCDLLNSHFSTTRTHGIIDSIKNTLVNEMPAHIQRWKIPSTYLAWENNIDSLKSFLINRNELLRDSIAAEFSLLGTYNLTVNSNDISKGFVKVNSININSSTPGILSSYSTWTGIYFDNIPIQITAKPIPGNKFTHWVYNGNTLLDSTITINSNSDRLYTAYFETQILSENPTPDSSIILNCGYKLKSWSSNNLSGTYPSNMKFVYFNEIDPTINSTIEGYTTGLYNYTSRTRITGHNQLGFSFINTTGSTINVGYPIGKLGGAILAMNTENLDSVIVSWKGRTMTVGSRKYAIRLQYREGDLLPFQDFDPIIEYQGSSLVADSVFFKNIHLPQNLIDKPYIQLLWKYYYTGVGTSGSRDQLAIDDISVDGIVVDSSNYSNSILTLENPAYIYQSAKITGSSTIINNANSAIILKPGFSTQNGAIFKAEIKICPD